MEIYLDTDDKFHLRLMSLLDLEEKRNVTLEHVSKHQVVIKWWFDKRVKIKSFKILDLVFIWDKPKENKGSHLKFNRIWMDPNHISKILGEKDL
jgi:hypothetical protein